MVKNGPVIIIEDDIDDQQFLKSVFKKLNYPNEVMFFINGEEALAYLKLPEIRPFIILSDIELPLHNGFDLREKLKTDAELHLRCIPYLFFTKAAEQQSIINAYSTSVQGFFIRQTEISQLEKMIFRIMEYWKMCATPNFVE